MKPTLAEYICREKADIFRQQQSVERMNQLLSELQDCFDQVQWQEASLTDATTDKDKDRVRSNGVARAEAKGASLSGKISQVSTGKCEIVSGRGATGRVTEKDSLGLVSISGSAPVKCKAKCDNYRLELLKQIEEKQSRKQLEIEREKAADEELEKRIAQQRLAMYLDYIEERKSGHFISKPKPIEQDAKTSADRPTAKCPTSGPVPPKAYQNKEALEQGAADPVDQARRTQAKKGAEANKDGNILANLNEVRQIMQHDHIEMLEKLLELHIQ